MNVYLTFEVEPIEKLPSDLQEPSGLAVYDGDGERKEIIVLNEGTDSEYKFTDLEKEQLSLYLDAVMTRK
ncbi:hypothetical protein ACFQPF_11955 [Fictibacillus iocasae]|uniref:Uncharacterized protein n=2 Tax=Fictibacillus iocasae TaxID=2715437 RepID=A0ABW2NSQ7_9BACL